MVSRIEFFCPGCGAPEVPELILREYYTCPNCETTTEREKLDRQRRNNYLLAGATPGGGITATVVGSGSFFDPTQATASISITNCVFQAGDMCCVCYSANLTGGPGTPSSTTVGGLNLATTGGSGTQNDNAGDMIIRYNISAGAKTVVIGTFSGGNPTALGAIVLAIRGVRTASALDGAVGNVGSSASFDTTSTGALLFSNEFAVSMVAKEDASLNGRTGFANGFTWIAFKGTDQGGPPNDCTVEVGVKQLTSSAAAQSTGQTPSNVDWVAIISTFKSL